MLHGEDRTARAGRKKLNLFFLLSENEMYNVMCTLYMLECIILYILHFSSANAFCNFHRGAILRYNV